MNAYNTHIYLLCGMRACLLSILFVVALSLLSCNNRQQHKLLAATEHNCEKDTANYSTTLINPVATNYNGDMVFIPGGEFSMGAQNPLGLPNGGGQTLADARPIHRVKVEAFLLDSTEVTNEQFAQFVNATGYKTIAEQPLSASDFPNAKPEDLLPGAVVFVPGDKRVVLNDNSQWWQFVAGANWQHPFGVGSSIEGMDHHPVVHIAWEDAQAYCKWANKRLPTEAEWEFAARGGVSGKIYPWGDTLKPNGYHRANIFQGVFPNDNTADDGYTLTAPVGTFAPNNYGLYDMAGNVWEWCSDWYDEDYYCQLANDSLSINPKGPSKSFDSEEPEAKKKVIRGGSFLCTEQYCTRYMVGARSKSEYKTGASHTGFRCAKNID